MKEVLLCLLLAALGLFMIGTIAVAIACLILLGGNRPEYGIPIVIFLWMAAAWGIHHYSKG